MTASRQARHKAGRYPIVRSGHDCERELKGRPDYSVGLGTPAVFVCSCGRVYDYYSEESEGAGWQLREGPGPLDVDRADPGTRAVVDRMLKLDPPVSPAEDEAWREVEST